MDKKESLGMKTKFKTTSLPLSNIYGKTFKKYKLEP